ncbi:MAG TPA: M42 family metallopeptidase [Clostridiales bacterium]|nr:M42 family metallopeptidase [Clostridiales bacterium]
MDLKQLTDIDAVSGNENALRRAIVEAARALCDDVTIDRSGNVIATKPGTDDRLPHVVLSAHMDEVGFMIVGYTDDGLLRIRPIGGIDPRVAVSKWVRVGKDALPGVIGAMAIHLQTPEDRQRVLAFDKLYIDIGAKDQKEAERLCPLGTYAAFDTPYTPFGDGFVAAKALDDRVGCLSLLRILENDYAAKVTCAFVTQEEVGLRGAKGAAFTLQPDIAIVLEGTAANDVGDVPARSRVCEAGNGVCVSFMDGASIADRGLFQSMLSLAASEGIPHQVKRAVTGGNDAGAYQRTGAGARTVVLSVPCRYIHSGASVAKLSDIDAQYALAHAFLNNL